MKTRLGALLLLFLVMQSPAAAATPYALDPAQRSHLDALKSARTALVARGGTDQQRAAQALAILRRSAEGESAAIRELEANPPEVEIARNRLDTSIAGFEGAASDPDPQASNARLRSILAEPRFHPDEGPLAAVVRAINGAIVTVVRALLGPGPVRSLALFAAILAVVAVLVAMVPALRRPFGRSRALGGRVAGDVDLAVPAYFGEAERLAQAEDYAGAVRALAAGTMELVTGQRSFITSPMTVREAFGRSGQLDVLRPLLQAFESSYYGNYQVLAEQYRAAAAAALAYRRATPGEAAA